VWNCIHWRFRLPQTGSCACRRLVLGADWPLAADWFLGSADWFLRPFSVRVELHSLAIPLAADWFLACGTALRPFSVRVELHSLAIPLAADWFLGFLVLGTLAGSRKLVLGGRHSLAIPLAAVLGFSVARAACQVLGAGEKRAKLHGVSNGTARKALLGTVRGRTIELDEDLKLEGKRVVVTVEPDESGEVLTPDAQQAAWAAWVASGEQGPISDEAGQEFP
jgi:hypothetical protein